jgi:hypothetical protein
MARMARIENPARHAECLRGGGSAGVPNLVRHYFEPAKAMSPTAVGNRTLPPRNPRRAMFRAVGACNLYAQVPTASGLTALAHCSRSARLVGLG